MERITSAQNAKVKRVKELLAQAKARRKAGEFVCEGERLCSEVPAELVREVWMSESFAGPDPEAKARSCFAAKADGGAAEKPADPAASGYRVAVVPDSLFRSMGDTATPQGVLAVCRMPEQPDASARAERGGKILLLEGLQDPGNLGTIFRTAEAAGISEIVLDRNCADAFSPKVVRATMGSVFRVPFSHCADLPALAAELTAQGWKTFAACLGADTDFRDADYSGNCAVMIGNEGSGLTEAALAAASERVTIPMKGRIESLNASVAAALMMYEAMKEE